MTQIYSASQFGPKDRFQTWRNFCDDCLIPLDHSQIANSDFNADVECLTVGSTVSLKFSLSNLRVDATPKTIRSHSNRPESLWINLTLCGNIRSDQNSFNNVEQPGDLAIRDSRTPVSLEYRGDTELLLLEIPRNKLEDKLGSARAFAGLTVNGNLPTAALARSFLSNLSRVSDQLSFEAAERMTSVSIDLVAAAIAERMAIETPKSMLATVTVQRAKAPIEAHLADTSLDPSQVAAAVRISIRHLHMLFRQHGRSVVDWIWQRRLEVAATRLSDPACSRLPLGSIAYGCGFADQSHFAHRFRDRYGMTAREYRQTALSNLAVSETER